VKSALHARDEQLSMVESRLRQLQETASQDTQKVADQVGDLKGELQDLQPYLRPPECT
jgi:hypothetical protein